MKAYRIKSWQHSGELEDVPIPAPGPGETLIRIGGAGACHSDLHIMHEWTPEKMHQSSTSRLDHRHRNYGVPELGGKIPTTENLATPIWNYLEPKIEKGKLHRVRLYESPDLFVDCYGNGR